MAKEKQKNRPIFIKELLEAKNQELHMKDDLFGMTLLTNPGLISSSRNIMLTSHLRQFVNLQNGEIPRVLTNYEDVVGSYSTSYDVAEEDYIIKRKILRYQDIESSDQQYMVFMYDQENDRFHVVTNKKVENLTEKYGYEYNTDYLDQRDEGDRVAKGDVYIKSKSYDDEMHYMYGLNATYMYGIDNRTIEDAVTVSTSLSKRMTSIELDTVRVSLNDNDIFCNIYGDSSHYKAFPNIGESVRNTIVCATRRMHNSQLLFDLKQSNLRTIDHTSDKCIFCDGQVIDITVYSNKPRSEIEENQFNRQTLYYLDDQDRFYREMLQTCEDIISTGSSYTKDIKYWLKKSRDYLDDSVKWREEDNSVFSNMIIEFTIRREVPLKVGQKITGRYGNKGIISTIVPDEEMPVLENGKRVEVIFNTLGVINRLNSQQLYEQTITFICNRTVEQFKILKTNEERYKLMTSIVSAFNKEQAIELDAYYDNLTIDGQYEFFADTEKYGMYIHIPPMWEEEPLFDRVAELYRTYEFLKPYDVFIQKFGRRIKVLKPMFIGEMYLMKLKQSSEKGFSARSTGSISKKGVPEKSNTNKTHQDPYSKTPIRIGVQENTNVMIGVKPEIIAQLHAFHRSSVEARQNLGERLISETELIEELEYGPEFRNRNIEIFNTLMKTLGCRMVFEKPGDMMYIDDGTLMSASYEDQLYIGKADNIKVAVDKYKFRKELEADTMHIMDSSDYREYIDHKYAAELVRRKEEEILTITVDKDK